MTLSEVASYLKLAEKTVLRMIHRGQIPCAKVGGQWRFMRTVIEDWLISRMQVVPRNDLAALMLSEPDLVPLSRLMQEEYILLDLEPGSKEEVLEQLLRPLRERGLIGSGKAFLDKLLQREQMASTALGRGIAIPHLRNPRENPQGSPALVTGICRSGADFESPDGKKTYLFFLLCTDSEVVHLRVMAKLTRLLAREIPVSRLLNASSREEVLKIILAQEMQAEGGSQ